MNPLPWGAITNKSAVILLKLDEFASLLEIKQRDYDAFNENEDILMSTHSVFHYPFTSCMCCFF